MILRFDERGARRPDFVLNRAPYDKARFLICGENFGCGSSREHAVWGLLQIGVRAVVAPSFAGIFFGNCEKNGLLAITLPADAVERLHDAASKPDTATLAIDLPEQRIRTPDAMRSPSRSSPPARPPCCRRGPRARDPRPRRGDTGFRDVASAAAALAGAKLQRRSTPLRRATRRPPRRLGPGRRYANRSAADVSSGERNHAGAPARPAVFDPRALLTIGGVEGLRALAQHIHQLILFRLGAGARPRALLELRLGQMDVARRLIQLNAHGREQNKKHCLTVKMPDKIAAMLDEGADRPPDAPVIHYHGEPVAKVKTAWRKLRTRCRLGRGGDHLQLPPHGGSSSPRRRRSCVRSGGAARV